VALTKKQIWIIAGVGGVLATALVVGLVVTRKRKNKVNKKIMSEGLIVKGEYVVPKGTPNMGDALHSFERRKSDGFGGRMSTKIKEALVDLYKKGINPDVTDLKINIDSKNYKVTWEATIKPSTDGKAYTGFMTFGSAGSGADKRAIGQEERMKKIIGGKDYKLVLDFKNPTGIYIRQFFYKYTKDEYPAIK
jgi:hypothetical protein